MSDFIANPVKLLTGTIKIPGDKSISHRSVILGSLANGVTKVSGFLLGEDTLTTLRSFQAMGVNIQRDNDNLTIHGVGIHGLKKPKTAIDLGNSGTAMRLMAGVLAAQQFNTTLYGDKSLSKRPMSRVIEPLTKMGAIISSNNGKPPLTIQGGNSLTAINYRLPIASAQVKSCLLLAGLYAQGNTYITEPQPTRDHTERMLIGLGIKITHSDNQICLQTGGLTATNIKVPGDISSAAFFMVAASIAPKACITLTSVNINPTRTGVIDILQLMGANIILFNKQKIGGELLADIRIKSAKLTGINIPKKLVPLAIDEFPVIFIAASCAQGETVLTDAKELKVKESDRIQVMANGLGKLGIKTQVLSAGIKIQGGKLNAPSSIIASYHDHRIAMSFAIASLRCSHPIKINSVDNVATSFPNFVKLANQIGMNIKHELT